MSAPENIDANVALIKARADKICQIKHHFYHLIIAQTKALQITPACPKNFDGSFRNTAGTNVKMRLVWSPELWRRRATNAWKGKTAQKWII